MSAAGLLEGLGLLFCKPRKSCVTAGCREQGRAQGSQGNAEACSGETTCGVTGVMEPGGLEHVSGSTFAISPIAATDVGEKKQKNSGTQDF